MSSVAGAPTGDRFTVLKALPSAFAALAFIGVLLIPRAESFYVWGHVIAIVSALAATLTFLILKIGRNGRSKEFLFGVGLLGCASAITAGLLLSFGSKANASGDIGGFPLWLLSSIGLLALLMISATEKNPEPTDRLS
ncbi:hypothetical protein CQ018_17075 [Arthrobacter sp. MYb227]|uniref:hypothetical protein n=1 Tax=Arthrobacter sp. MYb227 TaxID=1848601 RepID=UPI000CFD8E3B|nr:hypothetical protein [Arthrobacter sp. MYb227]PQZ88158.1 hypothetical protein CQ018_17075 [Arthrobacter sp. MYb227]